MAEAIDYFSNHRLKLRFPWRFYHAPIVEALRAAVSGTPGPNVLNVGSGPFFELPELGDSVHRFTICDIDPRAIELAREIHGEKLAGADVIDPDATLPYGDNTFDLVVSMDVIEHTSDPLGWLRELARVLKPAGRLFLSTPNYGSFSLRAIEATVLEAIARLQGFTRNGLHPSKFDAGRLTSVLGEVGLAKLEVTLISFGWVLAVEAEKPSP